MFRDVFFLGREVASVLLRNQSVSQRSGNLGRLVTHTVQVRRSHGEANPLAKNISGECEETKSELQLYLENLPFWSGKPRQRRVEHP
jgi:O-succinylbenzoate synthase